MSEWVDVAVYSAFFVTVWGWLPSHIAGFTGHVVAHRNPKFAAAHPETAVRSTGGTMFRVICGCWAAASVAVLLSVQQGLFDDWLPVAGAPRWESLKEAAAVLAIGGIAFFVASAFFFGRWLAVTVPLAERRRASLAPRSIDEYVSRRWQVSVYAVVALHLAAWLFVGVRGTYSTPAFWGTMLFQIAIAAILLGFVAISIRRKPNAMDRIAGPAYRRTEVRTTFALQLLPLGNGLARLYEEVTGTLLVDVNRVLHLAIVLIVLVRAVRPGRMGGFITDPHPLRAE
jgi:hypothetical protein